MSTELSKKQHVILHAYLITLSKSMRGAMQHRIQAVDPDMSTLQFGIMRTLYHEGSLTITELARRFQHDPSTLVPSVDAMERKELVRRERDPHDRRRLPLVLTEAGRAMVETIPGVAEGDPVLVALNALPPDDVGDLLRILHDVIAHLPDGEAQIDRTQERVRVFLATMSLRSTTVEVEDEGG